MSWLDFLKSKKPRVAARYDAAETTHENRDHWSMTDSFNADQSHSPYVRDILRRRSRYEYDNNPWLQGMILQVAEDLIGTGPRLQILSDVKKSSEIEKAFLEWANEVDLFETLRTARITQARDGEAFIQLKTAKPGKSGISLYPLLLDCERVASPDDMPDMDDDNQADGVFFDNCLRPVGYSVLVKHPNTATDRKTYRVADSLMIHLFRRERPEQHRGIPEITAALPSIAILRRYTMAMVRKMETCADISGVVTSTADSSEDGDGLEPWKKIAIPRGSLLTMPGASDIHQLETSTPTTSQQEFALQVKVEAARCLLATRNVVTGDSSSYNYASGRLDFQNYDRAIRVQRHRMERRCLDKILAEWWREYAPGKAIPDHEWHWDGRTHVDPVKEANAEKIRMANGTLTLADACAAEGKDWQAEVEQKLKEEKFESEKRREMGLPPKQQEQQAAVQTDEGDE